MRWSAVIPVFNEAAFLPRTLLSLAAQTVPCRLLVVDNGSTDGGVAAAMKLLPWGRDAVAIREPVPGQVHALRRGIAAVETEFVAICDADTFYPPRYLATAERLFDAGGPSRVVTAAWLKPEDGGRLESLLSAAHRLTAAALMPRQNHTSGAGHCFRTGVLRAAGGYDAAVWPYVLKDHELMHRVLKLGRQAWHRDLWCVSSDRRGDRRRVRWTLSERLAYHLTPFALKDRFFHGFLAPRFAARGQKDTVLRERSWA